jgi:hypothetical protein
MHDRHPGEFGSRRPLPRRVGATESGTVHGVGASADCAPRQNVGTEGRSARHACRCLADTREGKRWPEPPGAWFGDASPLARYVAVPRLALCVHAAENPMTPEAFSGSCVLVRDTDSQLLTSLLATASECLATPLRFHTRTESVRLEPPRVTRTVGRLPHGYSKYGLGNSTAQTGKVSLHREIGQGTSSDRPPVRVVIDQHRAESTRSSFAFSTWLG